MKKEKPKKIMSRFKPLSLYAFVFVFSACAILKKSEVPRNLQPTVILVSIDGFRWDYLQRGFSPNLESMIGRGVRATALVPVFPSLTFPNHFSIVTGVYPEKHGIVANEMLDRESNARFTISDRASVDDPRWWQANPIWVTLENLGKRTATLFWVGSNAEIHGRRPSYYLPYKREMPRDQRVDQVLDWIDLPDADRPVFLTLYFEDVDSAGHRFGPDSDAVNSAIQDVDSAIGRLLRGLSNRGLSDLVHVVVVSDHGMATIDKDHVLNADKWFSRAEVDVVGNGALLGLFPKTQKSAAEERKFIQKLGRLHPNVRLWKKEQTPLHFHYRKHPRIAPYLLVADEGWYLSVNGSGDTAPGGAHGYDPRFPSMHGILVATGPSLEPLTTVPSFENIHVYALLRELLRIPPQPEEKTVDADVKEINPLLKTK